MSYCRPNSEKGGLKPKAKQESTPEAAAEKPWPEGGTWVHLSPQDLTRLGKMEAIDSSEHYEKTKEESPASLLVIILDTNPHAWFALDDQLPLTSAIAHICVFINAHLAFNDANKVAVIASHNQRAVFLYPTPPTAATQHDASTAQNDSSADVEMVDASNGTSANPSSADANKYRPFHQVQQAMTSAIQKLMDETKPESLASTTAIAGALTLALTYINKQTILANSVLPSSDTNATGAHDENAPVLLTSRILILSVSGDLANQYIPIMNTIFACQRKSIPIDIAKIAGDSVFLQQASDATKGIFIQVEHPQGLLQYLMMGFLSDPTSRQHLISATQAGVDFRAACFCHRKVIDMGYVCSICLSIFCSPPEGSVCLTCGTHLSLGDYGKVPAVIPKKKKDKKGKAKEKVADTEN
ncbi:MAG: RNA polymerase II transcription factor B subunit 4 [Heterodermia speciosa]|uniref:General transcription and DNA repair factor IIH subunit TFB4 n=1 Tax=Heterodermia speciosa TaxID=116794 RepID=A0A8H3IDR9_9LECA|nr:MAG: RNA polymerase II transcription factor B subunit 4 [Heterodermia speciosa]